MNVKEEAIIHRLPSFVWPYLASTEMLPRWNSQILRIFPKEHGPFRPHFKFDVTLLVKGNEHEYSAEVVEFIELRRIVFKLRSKTNPSLPESTECITLSPLVKGTKIERTTEIFGTEKTISWWVKLLQRLFGCLNKPKATEYSLKRLAQVVEQRH